MQDGPSAMESGCWTSPASPGSRSRAHNAESVAEPRDGVHETAKPRAAPGWQPMLGHDGRLKGRSDPVQLGRWHLLDHGQLLPATHGTCGGSMTTWTAGGSAYVIWAKRSLGFSLSGPKSQRRHCAPKADGCCRWGICHSWAAAHFDVGMIRATGGARHVRLPANWATRFNCRMGDHITLRTGAPGRPAPMTASASTDSTPCCRCGWKKVSASGPPNSPRATRPA